MYIHETQYPVSSILELDVLANLILRYLTREVNIPTEKEMLKSNQKQLEAEMQIPWLRITIDRAYREAMDDLPGGHWSDNENDERCVVLNRMAAKFLVNRIARDMKDAKYPVNFGDMKKLSKLGDQVANIIVANGRCRAMLQKDEDAGWKTFRDNNQTEFISLFTNTSSCPFKGHWIDLKTETEHPTITNFK